MYENFPYTNMHNLNLDWFLNEFKKLTEKFKQLNLHFDTVQEEFAALKQYVMDYFKNLDLTKEVSAKIDVMFMDGFFDDLIANYFKDTAIIFKNVEEMKASTKLHEGATAITLGYYAAGDGGGATYNITSTSPDTSINIDLNNMLYATLLIENNTVNINQIGAKNNGIDDDTPFLNILLNKKFNIKFNGGNYLFKGIIYLPDHSIIDGNYSTINSDSIQFTISNYCTIQNLNFIIKNECTSSIFYLNNSRNNLFNHIKIEADERFNISNFSIFELKSTNADDGVFFNTFNNILIRNCKQGIIINSVKSPGWINDNLFNNIVITAFINGINMMGSGFIQNNKFKKITLQDGINSSVDRYGLILNSSTNNNFELTSWADAINTTNKFYAIKFNNPINKNIRNTIYGYIEGLIDNPEFMIYSDFEIDFIEIDRSSDLLKTPIHLSSNAINFINFDTTNVKVVSNSTVTDTVTDNGTGVNIARTGISGSAAIELPALPNGTFIFTGSSNYLRANIETHENEIVTIYESFVNNKIYKTLKGGTKLKITFIPLENTPIIINSIAYIPNLPIKL